MPTLSAAEQTRVGRGLPPNEATSKLSIVAVTLPSGTGSPDSLDKVLTRNGHALVHQSLDTAGGAYLGKIIYDNNTVYQNPFTEYKEDTEQERQKLITIANIALSNNGLHYGYVLEQNDNYSMYIDGRLVKSTQSLSHAGPSEMLGISNDGLHYAYYDGEDNNTGTAFKNDRGEKLTAFSGGSDDYSVISPNYTSDISSRVIRFDDTLNHYIAHLNGGYIVDGKHVDVPGDIQIMDISGNGKYHYVSVRTVDTTTNTLTVRKNPHPSCYYKDVMCSAKGPPQYLASGYTMSEGNIDFMLNESKIFSTPTVRNVATFADKETRTQETGPDKLETALANSGQLNNHVLCGGVNNSGDDYFIKSDESGKTLVIKARYAYPLKMFTEDSIEYCGVNDDLTHYFVYGKNTLNIDGVITHPTNIYSVELRGNTLFQYIK